MNKSSEIVSFENFTEDIHYDTKYEYIEFKGITCTEGCGELVSTKGEMCGNCAYQLTDDERYLY